MRSWLAERLETVARGQAPTLDPVRLVFVDLAIRSGRPSGTAARASEIDAVAGEKALKGADSGLTVSNGAVIQLEGSPDDG